MAKSEALRRLGGGRWESKDGQYTVEPQSGTWVLVDNTQTNELGLPLVRGPYPSLTAAREAIEEGRESGPAESPLADRIKATPRPKEKPAPKQPERSSEPKWLRDLDDGDRRKARAMIKRLESAGIEDAEAVARSEIADEQPALAQLALERRFGGALEAKDAAGAVRRVVETLLEGRDEETSARWRLVDGADRQIRRLDLPD